MSIQGKDSLFYIYYNSVWFPVACLTSSPLSEDSDELPTTTRDNQGWKSSIPTLQSYNIALSGVVTFDGENQNVLSYRKLRSFKRNRELIQWQRRTLTNVFVDTGYAYITSISDSDEVDSEITFEATLKGYGMPTENDPGDPSTSIGGFTDITQDY